MADQSARLDADILRLSNQGLSQSQIAAQLTREGNSIAQTTVGRRLRILGVSSLGKGTPNGITPAKRVILTRLMDANGGPLGPDDFQGSGGVVGGQLTALLHALKKAGFVTLVESTSTNSGKGHSMAVKRVEITEKGRIVINPPRGTGHAILSDPVKTEPLTDYLATSTHSDVLLPKVRTTRSDPNGVYVSEVPEPLDIVEDRTDEQLAADGDSYEPDERLAEPEINPDTPVEHETPVWPVLDRLRERQAKVLAASKLLEEAGLDDAALAALDALRYSDLETEYLAFADACQR